MRRLILALLLPFTVNAQEVDTHREIKVAKSQSIELTCSIKNDRDSSYLLTFRDTRYVAINRYASVPLSRKETSDLAVSLYRLAKDEYKPKESSITLSDLLLLKEMSFGESYIAMSYKGATVNFTNLRKSTEFAKDIALFLTGRQ